MAKPWEERWETNGEGSVFAHMDESRTTERRTGLSTEAVATFIAQAPAMARLLDEWLREGDIDPERVRAVLAAAGVRP